MKSEKLYAGNFIDYVFPVIRSKMCYYCQPSFYIQPKTTSSLLVFYQNYLDMQAEEKKDWGDGE